MGKDWLKLFLDMNIRYTKKITALIAAALTVAVTSANAMPDFQLKALVKRTLANVVTPEKPIVAAKAVSQTPAKDKEQVAVALVQAVMQDNKSAALAVVSAICKSSPEVAPAVAKAAAKLYSAQAAEIAAAAIDAAPAFAQQIVQSVVSVVPTLANHLNTNTRSSRSADSPAASGGITTTPGIAAGITSTPRTPPSPPANSPVNSFDPNRYATPTPP